MVSITNLILMKPNIFIKKSYSVKVIMYNKLITLYI